MSPEQRRASASLAARARWSGTKPQLVTAAEAKREAALRKIAVIFEEQMTSMGLSETEKNARVAEFAAFVDSKSSASLRLAPSSQRSFKTRLSGLEFIELSEHPG